MLEAIALLAAGERDVALDVIGAVDGWEPPSWEGYRQRIRERAALPDLAGRVRFLVGEVTHTLTSGGMVHVRAGQPHEVQADEPSHLLITLIG